MYGSKKYSIKDLEEARQKLKALQEKRENDDANNPRKYQADIRNTADEVTIIEDVLKMQGTIKESDEERINRELDTLFPNAQSKSIKEYRGKKYQIRYFPVAESRSGKVKHWGHKWVPVDK